MNTVLYYKGFLPLLHYISPLLLIVNNPRMPYRYLPARANILAICFRCSRCCVLVPEMLHHYATALLLSSQSTASRRRLVRDFRKMQTDPPTGVSAAPVESNIMQWQAVIFGYGYYLAQHSHIHAPLFAYDTSTMNAMLNINECKA